MVNRKSRFPISIPHISSFYMLLTLLGPQSRFRDKPLRIWMVWPQNWTAVLIGLRGTVICAKFRRVFRNDGTVLVIITNNIMLAIRQCATGMLLIYGRIVGLYWNGIYAILSEGKHSERLRNRKRRTRQIKSAAVLYYDKSKPTWRTWTLLRGTIVNRAKYC